MNKDNKERKNIVYLTNRKKKRGLWEKFLDTFCCCFMANEESYEEEEEED